MTCPPPVARAARSSRSAGPGRPGGAVSWSAPRVPSYGGRARLRGILRGGKHADARPGRGARRAIDGHRRPRADQGPVLTRIPLADRLYRRPVSQRTAWWEGLYATSDVEDLPWYTPDLDKDFERALTGHRLQGKRILDLGTGPATQAMNLAKRGFDVIGTDISSSAIKKAKAAAKAAGLTIEFRVDDILTSKLPAGFVDVIIDRGVFHVLPPEKRSVYVDTVLRILRPHGWLLLKCFSDKQPGTFGPYRISSKELRGYFAKKFEILSIADSTFQGTLKPNPKTLFATFRRS